MEIKVTYLADNHASMQGVRAEHGFSIFIETPKLHILFDTGSSADLFYKNSRELGLELYGTDAVILSHGHYDHACGIAKILAEAPESQLYLSYFALHKKFKLQRNGIAKQIGIPEKIRKAIKKAEEEGRVTYVDEFREIIPELILFSTGGRVNLPDDWDFYSQGQNSTRELDNFRDEISLVIKGESEACLFSGCSHCGLMEIFEEASKLSDMPITKVIGGSHLFDASDEEIERTALFFKERSSDLYLGHCTGITGFSRLYRYLGDKLHAIHTGMSSDFYL